MFYLARVNYDRSERPEPSYGEYENGLDAAAAAKNFSYPGHKLSPRRITPDTDWRPDAQLRLEGSGNPSLSLYWPDLSINPDHFARYDREEGVGFYADDRAGIFNRLTWLRPGRYLAQFHSGLDDAATRALMLLLSPTTDILFATDEDGIEWVYERGPSSCMTRQYHAKHGGRFNSPIHPVRVYAAGDLAVAHTLSKAGNKVAERALCWPEKKIYSRVYSDGSDRLQNTLDALGYTWGDPEAFRGARLLRIEHSDGFVCPYIDRGTRDGGGSGSVTDDGEFLRMNPDGEIDADQTDGCAAVTHDDDDSDDDDRDPSW